MDWIYRSEQSASVYKQERALWGDERNKFKQKSFKKETDYGQRFHKYDAEYSTRDSRPRERNVNNTHNHQREPNRRVKTDFKLNSSNNSKRGMRHDHAARYGQNKRFRSSSYRDDLRESLGNRTNSKEKVRKDTTLDISALAKIEKKSPGEIVHALHNQIDNLEDTLQQYEMVNELIVVVLKLLSKSSQSQISTDSLSLLITKTLDSAFMKKHLPNFIASSSYNEDYIWQTLTILKCIIQFVPLSSKKILILLQTIKGTLLGKQITDEIAGLISQIEESCINCFQKKPKETPQSYKTMSVIPTESDIHSENPFLKPLKKRGKYENKDEFLSAHFWLLREDFLRPLRKGIEEYQHRMKSNSSIKNITTVKIYDKVKIIGPKCSFHSIAHTIRFCTSKFRRMRWKSSKRLMEGSLLCLSSDHFKTMHFAVVSQRRIYDLQNGFIDVKFVCMENIMLSADQTFTMVESDAYFESYRHILKRLQMIEELPFQRYLVSTNINIQAPKYIMNNTGTAYKMTVVGNETRNIFPLLDTTWPSMGSLGLDYCQYEAMKCAITQELALIQGPPGTGKTYIGLKIVEYFLQNKEKINNSYMHNKPILVVCYTNHALDQFLEGIDNLMLDPRNKSIIRVGGGCKSEIILPHTIRLARKSCREYPYDLKRAGIASARNKKHAYRNLTSAYMTDEMFKKGIVHEHVLEEVMGQRHYEDMLKKSNERSFRNSSQYQAIRPYCNKHLQHFALLEWLLKHDSDIIEMLDGLSRSEINKTKSSKSRSKNKREEFVEDEYDGEYSQRQLDVYDEDYGEFEDAFQVNEKLQNNSMALIFPPENDLPYWMKNWTEVVNTSERMNREQTETIKDIWSLSSKEKWNLYNYWTYNLKQKERISIDQLEEVYANFCTKNLEILDEKDKIIMEKASVIGMTTTGVAKYQHILQEIQPKIVIIEEAAEILEAHVVTTLNKSCEQLILIGDHKQLRPKPASYDLAEKFNLKVSLFERLIINGLPHVTLEEQHRMRPEISLYMKHIYKEVKDHKDVTTYESINGVKGNVCFIGHAEMEDQESDLMSKSNDHEAKFLGAMARYLIDQGYDQSRITVLTPYMGQVLKLRKYLPRSSYPFLRVTAVDNYQGEENDIILMSLVRSNPDDELGFVKEENRICVALSRAKIALYVIGNFQMLTAVSPLWKRIIDTAHCNGHYKEGLEVFCQNHPDETDILKNGLEFTEKVPRGGCRKPCEYRLQCGHTCKMKCHPFDKYHEKSICKDICNKMVCEKHKCVRPCHFNEECGKCMELVEKEMPNCKHNQEVHCSGDLTKVVCQEKCQKILDCDHLCSKKCGEEHTQDCEVLITRELSCGHITNAPCHMETEDLICRKKCSSILNCGHVCIGTCGKCLQGRIHIPCESKCERPLVCGHKCKSKCSVICPPCQAKCENSCKHSKCSSTCGECCTGCREPCQWSCRHERCNKECSEICTRKRCNEPCKRELRCGHQCIGLCGEICPRLCRICSKDEVEDIFFGTEEDEDAKFIELHDCGHVLEVSGLDNWMDGDMDNVSEISVTPKTCPKCKTPIKKTKRYHSIIQKVLLDVNRVKTKIWGDWAKIETMQQDLDQEILKLPEEEVTILLNIDSKMKRRHTYLSKHMVICMQNTISVFVEINKIQSSLNTIDQHNENYQTLMNQLEVLWQWNSRYREFINEQEVDELQRELQRMSLFRGYTEIDLKRSNSKRTLEKELGGKFDDMITKFRKGIPFEDADLQNGKYILRDVQKSITGLSITEEERVEIVKAMGLKSGAWYKCANGHIYSIGECGGAMEESNCPECKETIGGKRHTLADGNQHASEMDRSRFAAWSDQANMLNYDFIFD